jgi:hypothetical protein
LLNSDKKELIVLAQKIFDELKYRGFSVRLVTEDLVQIFHDGMISNIKIIDDFGKKRWFCNVAHIDRILLDIQS